VCITARLSFHLLYLLPPSRLWVGAFSHMKYGPAILVSPPSDLKPPLKKFHLTVGPVLFLF